MEREDSMPKTLEHITNVQSKIRIIIYELVERSAGHDKSKLEEPKKSIFDIYTPKLKNTTYRSEEYKQYLKEMGKALDHHYENNRHHPEHFSNGINQMNLVDIVEMFCDWLAATERHSDGDIITSIEKNRERFGYNDDLKNILLNTARDIFGE